MPRPVRDPAPEIKAAAHFAALDLALSRGDYAAAAKSQQALSSLGWEIRHRPHDPRYEAGGKGAGQ